MGKRPKRLYTQEVCPYDNTLLVNGEPCERCEEDIQSHLVRCGACRGDYEDLRERDRKAGE